MDAANVEFGKNLEFYIEHDSIPLHAKLEFPESVKRKASGGGTESGDSDQKIPLVIVQHGFTGHMEEDHITGVSRTLNECGFATLRTELYGHGMSGGEFSEHTLFKWLSEMLTVIDYCRSLSFVSDLFLCGHSQGGLIVMLAGAMKQDQIRAIIPLSPAAMIPEDARKGTLLGHEFDPVNIPELIDLEDGQVLKGNYARVARQIYVEPAMDEFYKDVLIIHGDEDEAVPVEVSLKAEKHYRNIKLVIIHGDDHCYNYHLDEVLSALSQFMKQYID